MRLISTKTLAVAALLCSSSIVSGLSSLSVNYESVLDGTVPLTPDLIDEMYTQFLAEFRDKPSTGFLSNLPQKIGKKYSNLKFAH